MTNSEKMVYIHNLLVNGQKKEMVKEIDEWGDTFWEDYRYHLEALYMMPSSQYEYFANAVVSYHKIKRGDETGKEKAFEFYDDIKETMKGYEWTSNHSWSEKTYSYDGKASVSRLINICKNNRIYSIKNFEQMTRAELKKIRGIGCFVCMACEEYLKRKGTSFKEW